MLLLPGHDSTNVECFRNRKKRLEASASMCYAVEQWPLGSGESLRRKVPCLCGVYTYSACMGCPGIEDRDIATPNLYQVLPFVDDLLSTVLGSLVDGECRCLKAQLDIFDWVCVLAAFGCWVLIGAWGYGAPSPSRRASTGTRTLALQGAFT